MVFCCSRENSDQPLVARREQIPRHYLSLEKDFCLVLRMIQICGVVWSVSREILSEIQSERGNGIESEIGSDDDDASVSVSVSVSETETETETETTSDDFQTWEREIVWCIYFL